MNEIKVYAYSGSLQGVIDAEKRGERCVCHVCGTELIIALDMQKANMHKRHAGVYCPKSDRHVNCMVNVMPTSGPACELYNKLFGNKSSINFDDLK